MNSIYQSSSYQQRTTTEIVQVRSGFLNGLALAMVLWAMIAWMLVLLAR